MNEAAIHDMRKKQREREKADALSVRRPSVPAGQAVLIKVCAWCKRVKDPQGAWVSADIPLDSNSGAFTHGICPECMERVRTESSGYIFQKR